MQTWLVPFVYVAVILAVYLFAPGSRRALVQKKMRTEPNLYLISGIVLVVFANVATLTRGIIWIDYFTWVLMVVLLAVSIMYALKPRPEPVHQDEDNPLK